MENLRSSRLISTRVCERSFASRLDSGSSKRKTRGLRTIARAIATRCCCPPDNVPGLRCSSELKPIPMISDVIRIRSSTSSSGALRIRKKKDRLPWPSKCG